jgi:hypothetical protein
VGIFKVQALTAQFPVIKPAQRNATQKQYKYTKQNTKQKKQKQYGRKRAI